jgi:hypothetical protein
MEYLLKGVLPEMQKELFVVQYIVKAQKFRE